MVFLMWVFMVRSGLKEAVGFPRLRRCAFLGLVVASRGYVDARFEAWVIGSKCGGCWYEGR